MLVDESWLSDPSPHRKEHESDIWAITDKKYKNTLQSTLHGTGKSSGYDWRILLDGACLFFPPSPNPDNISFVTAMNSAYWEYSHISDITRCYHHDVIRKFYRKSSRYHVLVTRSLDVKISRCT